jgi:hypothetical protein
MIAVAAKDSDMAKKVLFRTLVLLGKSCKH